MIIDHESLAWVPEDEGPVARTAMGIAEKAAIIAACSQYDCTALERRLRDSNVAMRPEQFRRAVGAIAAAHGAVLELSDDAATRACGGSSGPGCSAGTAAIEIAKLALPVAARLRDLGGEDVIDVVVRAVTVHSLWHDAYGYVYEHTGVGPGYTYAGCSLSSCEPDDMFAGQLDGLLYQAARLLGAATTPACGPDCHLDSTVLGSK